jgi:hypothetical protein
LNRTATPDVTSFRYAIIFNSALREVRAIKGRYLQRYRGATFFGPYPAYYSRDLRAFAVMASATIEQCVEDLTWAHLYQLRDEIHRLASTPLGSKAGDRLLSLGEKVIDSSHGMKEHHFEKVTAVGDVSVTLTVGQTDSFKQLGKLRGEAAHSYIITLADPNDVWGYTVDLLQAARSLGVLCAGRPTGFLRI